MAAARKSDAPQKVHVFDVTFIPTIATTVAVVAQTPEEAQAKIRQSLFKPSTARSPANPGWHSMGFVKSADVPCKFEMDTTAKNPFKFDEQEAKLKPYLPSNWKKHTVSVFGSAPKKGGDAIFIALDSAHEKSVEMYAGSRDNFFVELVEQAQYLID